MFPASSNTTTYRIVLPFYLYAAASFLTAAILLFMSAADFKGHFFQPHILAITHVIALGWGTMIILGASHQLVPVIIEGKLYSEKLAYVSFVLAAIGIPLLVYGFYFFDMGAPAKWGGRLIVLSILSFLINIGVSISKSKIESIHAVFVFTATLWLFLTVALGLAQVYNFTVIILPKSSLYYLAMHAHAGIIGWFLLLIIGVGSRLIPMFLISKYSNKFLLKCIYALINTALLGFVALYLYAKTEALFFIPVLLLFAAVILFIYYCFSAYNQRIRKKVDEQMKMSLLSVFMLILPVVFLVVIIAVLMLPSGQNFKLVLTYGFLVFFGWITAIILGMTFKTLPFIMWNKIYHHRSGLGKTPNPKELFSEPLFKTMGIAYILGLLVFAAGILSGSLLMLKGGAVLLILAAIFYTINVMMVVQHKPRLS